MGKQRPILIKDGRFCTMADGSPDRGDYGLG